jgi:hypothetical protein
VTATSAQVGDPPAAAVDGSPATAWRPATSGATLTIDLGRAQRLSAFVVTTAASSPPSPFELSVSTDNRTWRRVATLALPAGPSSTIRVAVTGRWVRYTAAASSAVTEIEALNEVTGAGALLHCVGAGESGR